ncbi:MAG: hypothetical protein IPJ77_18325 [Planctomycetes bacterium]|nr:hypothetical protein [Planctomycetota bacterium]
MSRRNVLASLFGIASLGAIAFFVLASTGAPVSGAPVRGLGLLERRAELASERSAARATT